MSQSQRQHLDQWEKMVKVLSPERYESMKNYASQLLFELRNSDHLAAAKVHRPLPQVEVAAPEVLLPPPVPSKKRKAWTVEEHWMFLIGLDKYGKGDWKSIARDCVRTRTSTQIASHAQKYFLRQNASEKQRKRKSIHDIPLPESYSCLVLHPTRHRNWVPPPPPPHNWELFQHCHKSSPGLPFPPLSTPPPPSVSDPPPPIYNTSNDPFLFNTSLPYPAWPLDRIHVNGLNQTSKAYATANSLSSSDVATTQQQLQELQQAQQEIFYLNPPNILPQQIDEFGNFNNCLNNAEAAPCSAKYNAIGHKRSEM